MARVLLFRICGVVLFSQSMVFAGVVEHTFDVKHLNLGLLCKQQTVPAVNGNVPGPLIHVREGDTLIVHVLNNSPYNLTIHWHGIFQRLSAWADGPVYITQCPIRPEQSYTYKFNITGQEGTLWWHAHVQWLRATVYGGLIIYPRKGRSYPFQKPHKEFPIILGEWWDANPYEVEKAALGSGGTPNNSDAYTINGKAGHLNPICPTAEIDEIKVDQGKTYLLRIINAALNNQLFFKIANHNMTVVAIDAVYTTPYCTDVVLVAPGQTTDILLTADQPIGSYYMAASPYASAAGVPFDNTTATALLLYTGSSISQSPIMPILPPFNDTPTAHKFNSNLTSLVNAPFWEPVPLDVDEQIMMTIGLGLLSCEGNLTCAGPSGLMMAASINNLSFIPPQKLSILEAHYSQANGIYSTNFPNVPTKFNYTDMNNSFNMNLMMTKRSTTVKKLKYNATAEIVFQNTAFLGIENHPMHLHGFNFYVLAQGFGNYDDGKDRDKFNVINPQVRNTIGVPAGGWAVIRFRANNPGAWILHCHLDVHLPWGLATVIVVDNGGTPSSTLPPPPADFPKC